MSCQVLLSFSRKDTPTSNHTVGLQRQWCLLLAQPDKNAHLDQSGYCGFLTSVVARDGEPPFWVSAGCRPLGKDPRATSVSVKPSESEAHQVGTPAAQKSMRVSQLAPLTESSTIYLVR